MMFWTKAEYQRFAEAMMYKPLSYYAFEMLYWCGIREGELLALTPADFDFERGTVSISKSYQRLKGRDVITDPKTPKSNRVIKMPNFLCEEMQDFIKSLYGAEPTDRISAPGDGQGRKGNGAEAYQNTRPAAQPHFPDDKYGLFRYRHSRPGGP